MFSGVDELAWRPRRSLLRAMPLHQWPPDGASKGVAESLMWGVPRRDLAVERVLADRREARKALQVVEAELRKGC